MGQLVQLNRNGGDVSPNAGRVGWNLANQGIVYTHNKKGNIAEIFRNNAMQGSTSRDFQIFENGLNAPQTTRFLIVFGTYHGPTRLFDTMNYMHQRQALRDGIGVTGIKPIDMAWDVASTIADAGMSKIISGPQKYFVGFFNARKTHPSRVMHHQADIVHLYVQGQASVAQIFHQHRNMFFAKV